MQLSVQWTNFDTGRSGSTLPTDFAVTPDSPTHVKDWGMAPIQTGPGYVVFSVQATLTLTGGGSGQCVKYANNAAQIS